MKVLSIPVTCHGHYRPISDIHYNSYDSDGFIILSASKDGTAIVRDGVTGDWIGSLLGHKGAVWCSKLSSDSKLAFTGSGDFTAKVWSLDDGQCLHTIPHKHIVRSLDISNDNSKLISADNQFHINLYDVNKLENALMRKKIHDDIIRKLIFHENANLLFSISDDGKMALVDLRAGTSDPQIILSIADKLMDVTVDKYASENLIQMSIAYAKNVEAILVDLKMPTKQHDVISNLKLESEVNSIDVQEIFDLSNGKKESFIACGCTSGEILTYKNWACPQNWKEDDIKANFKECYKGHFGPVHKVKFSPQLKFKDFILSIISSGSEDGTVRLWQTFPGSEFGLWKSIEKSI